MPTMRQKRRKHRVRPIVTYDIETTRIEEGTPTPLYISWFDGTTVHGEALQSHDDLARVVIENLLIPEYRKSRFVAYNANQFDAPIIAYAVANNPDYRIEPWMTKSNKFRGMAIIHIATNHTWHFSDAMSMFGFMGNLRSFLATFAPDQSKGTIDVLNFDSTNPDHVEYAQNDSKSLWYAVSNAAQSVQTATGIPPQNTIGKTAILYFESQIPKGVEIRDVPYSAKRPLEIAKRGGYVHCAGRYKGPLWKYDINQAYASAMRKPLPAGRCIFTTKEKVGRVGLYHVTISRPVPTAVPFYIRDDNGTPVMTTGEQTTGWIISPEIDYLHKHGWFVMVHKGFFWESTFTMSDMVDNLEYNRINCEGGPKGPLGMIYKAVGNNAYGKTLETHDGLRIIFAKEQPEGSIEYMAEDEAYNNFWLVKEEPRQETYHKPQLGVFITAYVRIQIMETAHLSERTFVYADTDCIAYTDEMTPYLPIDSGKYGAYKLEANGETYALINKKVYYSLATDENGKPKTASSKGIHPNVLTLADFEQWYEGNLPKQLQTQRQNITKLMSGKPMFIDRERKGSLVLPFFSSG